MELRLLQNLFKDHVIGIPSEEEGAGFLSPAGVEGGHKRYAGVVSLDIFIFQSATKRSMDENSEARLRNVVNDPYRIARSEYDVIRKILKLCIRFVSNDNYAIAGEILIPGTLLMQFHTPPRFFLIRFCVGAKVFIIKNMWREHKGIGYDLWIFAFARILIF